MSFSFRATGPVSEVSAQLEADARVPRTLRDYVKSALASQANPNVIVGIYGHLHDGQIADYEVTVTPAD